jgi:ribosome biogenesis GTPase A
LEEVNRKINIFKDKGEDFQIRADFDYVYDDIKINKLKEYILKKKRKHHDFEIFVNDKLFYKFIYGVELFNIKDKNNFEEKLKEEFLFLNKLKISLRLYNVKDEYFEYYETFEIKEVEISSYIFQKELLNFILSNKKYEDIDKRNFNVIRERQSPKNSLLKYTGYYNQVGDILFCNKTSFFTTKINIAIGGFMGAGKSTLINTILGEKRCLEGQGGSITNYITQFSFNEYPINLVDFPGFRAKQKGNNNTSLFIKEIESKISDLKKMNEVFHCFLFCIKFQDRIFDEKDEDTLDVFKAIVNLKLRTFFLITNSEKEDSKGVGTISFNSCGDEFYGKYSTPNNICANDCPNDFSNILRWILVKQNVNVKIYIILIKKQI